MIHSYPLTKMNWWCSFIIHIRRRRGPLRKEHEALEGMKGERFGPQIFSLFFGFCVVPDDMPHPASKLLTGSWKWHRSSKRSLTPAVQEGVHRSHADGGMEPGEGLGSAPNPALPKPHSALHYSLQLFEDLKAFKRGEPAHAPLPTLAQHGTQAVISPAPLPAVWTKLSCWSASAGWWKKTRTGSWGRGLQPLCEAGSNPEGTLARCLQSSLDRPWALSSSWQIHPSSEPG